MPTKTTTLTSPPTLPERFTEAEETHLAEVAEVALTLAAASADLGAAEEALEDARDHLAEVEGALRRGSTSFVAADLGPARTEVDGAELALAGVRTRVQRARARGDLHTQTDAAVALVLLVKRALPGVPIVCTAIPKLPGLTAAEAPLVVLQQLDAAITTDGTILGRSSKGKQQHVRVRLSYVAGEIHREPDIRRFEFALLGGGLQGLPGLDLNVRLPHQTGIPRSLDNGAVLHMFDIATLEPAPVPAIPEPAGDASALAQRVGGLLVNQTPRASRHVSEAAAPSSSDLDGIRITEVAGTTALHFPATPGPGAREGEGDVNDLLGTFHAGLGRVTAVSTERLSPADFTWKVQLSSRTGWDVEHPPLGVAAKDDATHAAA